jgi:ABC-type sugar transport system substrate-binding protein
MGDPSDSYTTLIEEGFREVMEQYPEVIIETKIAQAWEASRAADIAEDWLTAHPDTDLIFPHSDHLTAAVVAVLQNKGYEKDDIILVSCTGMPMGLELIREGWISCIVEEPVSAQVEGIAMFLDDIIAGNTPELGPYLVKGIEAELIEMPYGPELRITGNVIDINNVDDPIWWGNQVGN